MLPPKALCFFQDGNKICCVRPDFDNLQNSLAGFGVDRAAAEEDLLAKEQIDDWKRLSLAAIAGIVVTPIEGFQNAAQFFDAVVRWRKQELHNLDCAAERTKESVNSEWGTGRETLRDQVLTLIRKVQEITQHA